MTNGEMIRQMDDDELAQFICEVRHPNDCNGCPGNVLCKMYDGRANGLKKWMRKKAEEEE